MKHFCITQERHKFSKHKILVRDVQVYACTHCNKQFIKKQAYEGHMRLHSGVKPHTCPTCDYSSTLFGALKRHLFVSHGRSVRRVFASGCSDETVYTLVDVDANKDGLAGLGSSDNENGLVHESIVCNVQRKEQS